MHQIVDLAIAGSNPVGHPFSNSFAEHALRVPVTVGSAAWMSWQSSTGTIFRAWTTLMPLLKDRLPKYRHYRPKDLAVVRIDGNDVYLGKYGSEESREKYRRVVAEWLIQGTPRPTPRPHDSGDASITVNDLILAFWKQHAEQHYRHADGSPTGELDNYRDSLRLLRRLYGTTPTSLFSPLPLKAVRQAMIESGLARTTINQRIGRIVHLFKWGVENELISPTVHQAIKAVAGLQKGRTKAREPEPVRPVAEASVEAIREFVTRQVWAMIELQRLTGMRPGEVTSMRSCDVDTSEALWIYRPAGHKTAHHGRERSIFLGPRAQEVLRPWLRADPADYLFSPREAVTERLARRRQGKPVAAGKRRSNGRAPGRAPGDRYTTQTYHHAVRYGCARAAVPTWHPHQLRHSAATWLRKEFGLDAARVILGHTSASTAEIYAELDNEKARAVMQRVG